MTAPICPASFGICQIREPSLRLSGRCCYQNVSRWCSRLRFTVAARSCGAAKNSLACSLSTANRPLRWIGSARVSGSMQCWPVSTRSVLAVPHPLATHDRSFLPIPFGIATSLPGTREVHNLVRDESPVKMWLGFAQSSSGFSFSPVRESPTAHESVPLCACRGPDDKVELTCSEPLSSKAWCAP